MREAKAQITNGPRQAGPLLRLRSLLPDGPSVRCTTDGDDILVPRVPASYLSPGDDVCVNTSISPIREYSPRRMVFAGRHDNSTSVG